MAGGNDQAELLYGYADVNLVRLGGSRPSMETTGGHGFQAMGEEPAAESSWVLVENSRSLRPL